jgi:hypothetical protein
VRLASSATDVAAVAGEAVPYVGDECVDAVSAVAAAIQAVDVSQVCHGSTEGTRATHEF